MTFHMVRIISLLALLALVCAVFSGCAPSRYMTEEQDAEFRENCEPHGCTVIPNPTWRKIEEILIQLGVMKSS